MYQYLGFEVHVSTWAKQIFPGLVPCTHDFSPQYLPRDKYKPTRPVTIGDLFLHLISRPTNFKLRTKLHVMTANKASEFLSRIKYFICEVVNLSVPPSHRLTIQQLWGTGQYHLGEGNSQCKVKIVYTVMPSRPLFQVICFCSVAPQFQSLLHLQRPRLIFLEMFAF